MFGSQSLSGLSLDVIVVILYKLYVLFPYTNPTHHTKLFAFSKKNITYKLFSSWGPQIILEIDIFVETFCSH